MSAYTDKRILIVDDAGSMRHLIVATLNELGFKNVFEANNGKRAVEIVLEQINIAPIELIITDWKMPVMDGLQTLRFIRKALPEPQPLIMMLTSEGERASVIEAVKSGANGYLFKPFTKPTLNKALDQIFTAPLKNPS